MLYVLWLLPVFTSLVLFIIYRNALAYKIGAGAVIVIITYSLIHSSIIKDNLTKDTEWWGNYAVSVHYYDDWDEEVPCRHPIYCTRTYECGDGKTSRTCTDTYVCGYEHPYDVDYHPEYWAMRWDNGREDQISHQAYDGYVALWGGKNYKVELHRDYHSNDGDDMAADWDLNPDHSESLITQHEYENRVQASNSIFKADKVDSTDRAQYKLFDYPGCNNGEQAIVMGSVKITPTTLKRFKYINGYYGSKKEFKLFICCFRNVSEIAAERQHSYWDNCNKNEMLVCVGLDDANQVQWAHSYSWMDKPVLSVKIDQWFKDNRSLDLGKFSQWLPANIEEYWSRKHFRDFKYLQIEITQSQYTFIFVITFLLCLLQAYITKRSINSENNY